jgi:hypothetical protein
MKPAAVESLQGSEPSPALVVVAVAVLVFVVCVTNFALGAAIVGLQAFGGGPTWLAMDRKRIRDAEREWPMIRQAR